MELNEKLALAASYIHQADALLITAGAGMGIDSGLPDYRGENGFWRAFPPLARLNKNYVEMMTPDLFRTNPRLAWGFSGWQLNAYRKVIPHEGFDILKSWANKMKYGAFVYTSNVDGEFQKAGFCEEQVMECHGSVHYLQCCLPCQDEIWSAKSFEPRVNEQDCLLLNTMPRCPHCGGLARPNVMMFGDSRWLSQRMLAQEKYFSHWMREVKNLVIIELGAGTVIPTVRNFSQGYSEHFKAPLIRINLNEYQTNNDRHLGLPLGAKESLQFLNNLLENIAKCL
ncbi:SIR2 family NAD-dependent protein deacylase [Suttonella ornithocola]|uniref:protein acetyllysine N-acetyltransferase n=1 Tax=Suttonella ornithocola TaxID=279832 RepID=A0A380MTD6_9GAMM|nr:Sir2 family NAD-dependent protein deacetylase [Suttonella ornithocola]SUO95326.1 NAD-dependent deacetylase [Suttonella ornithocola]SUQ09733.1 NAD-dependent deacetylase [Suttonella ornithocola]